MEMEKFDFMFVIILMRNIWWRSGGGVSEMFIVKSFLCFTLGTIPIKFSESIGIRQTVEMF